MFNCEKGKDYSGGLHSDQKDTFCSSVDYSAHAGAPPGTIVPDGTKMEAVTYIPPKSKLVNQFDFPALNECPGAETIMECYVGTTAETKWVTDAYDGWTPQMQSIHMVEEAHSPGEDEEHSATYWGDTKGLVNTGDGYDHTDAAESWTIANVTAEATPKVGSGFPGGFGGKCPSGESWQLLDQDTPQERWTCSGRVSNWLQTVVVPDINPNDNGKETIGVVIMPYNFNSSTPSFLAQKTEDLTFEYDNLDLTSVIAYREAQWNDLPKIDSITESKPIENVTARCKPSGASNWKFKNAVDIDNSKTPTPVAVWGKAEVDGGEFVCEWWYFRQDEDGTGYDKITKAGVRPLDLSASGGRTQVRGNLTNVFKDQLGYEWISSQYGSEEFRKLVNHWEGDFFTKQW